MQKLINNPADAVLECLQGYELAYPHLIRVHYDPHFVYRIDAPVQGKVSIISGSGSGHEPLNIGYVGRGMLDAACPGAIFTSPTPDQYLAALKKVYGGVGALYVVKNYTGGVLNTELAMEMAAEEGFQVASVLVNDDVAVEEKANRRGMGAAVLVEKIAGAAAEQGRDLDSIVQVARRASAQTRSMGVALSSCTSPSVGRPTFYLPESQMEVGVGIHGEPGRRREPLVHAAEVVNIVAQPIIEDLELKAGDMVLAMVSGLGSTPQQELFIVFRYLHQLLTQLGVRVERQLVGNYITSLDMAGCLITLLRLDPELLELWDAPVRTPALCW
ncbi:dihydroxyacetone kinase subunit DhaK [Litorilinea aerophila]|uniref:Dihydroxyacetone kinase subunit DhaK n=1 Tax=Litorilinea aerophila TaxID=1204385 RepID=A0A540VAQ1_9CHLR|nr:dihydroxyacetone kinase subunit DhaK [Litorilinea aerophila]MCC9078349.1 dihydroxyacetone kinase subunit DhaK [Litorilinea aerophila]OUC08716.1 dihydroxyacetone kinase [Litorilinea aerophila]GIV77107.1 MAG: dihydroxyacetone kinase subunit DhaK [Litorilinea sp.]